MSVFFIFTVAQTKLPHYLLYGMTPIFTLSTTHLKPVNRYLDNQTFAISDGTQCLIIPSLIKWKHIETVDEVSIIEIGFWYSTNTPLFRLFILCLLDVFKKHVKFSLVSNDYNDVLYYDGCGSFFSNKKNNYQSNTRQNMLKI